MDKFESTAAELIYSMGGDGISSRGNCPNCDFHISVYHQPINYHDVGHNLDVVYECIACRATVTMRDIHWRIEWRNF